MRKFTLSVLILTAFLSTQSYAAGAKDIIFSCNTTDGKKLTIKSVGNDYEYNHGTLNFKNPAKQVLANEQSAVAVGSGFVTYSLELKHQGKSYVAGFIQARGSKSIDEPGVTIYKNGEYETNYSCNNPIVHHFDVKAMKNSGL